MINKEKALNTLRLFKGDALWLYGTRFSAVILQTATMFVIAAIVSIAEFGQFSFMFSASRIVSVIVGMGGAPFLHRELPYRDSQSEGAGVYDIFIKTELRVVFFVWVIIPFGIVILLTGVESLSSETYAEILFWLKNELEFQVQVVLILITGFLLSILDIIIAVLRNAKSATFSMLVNDCFPYLIFLFIFSACLALDISSAEMIMAAFSGALFVCFLIAFFSSKSYLNARRAKYHGKNLYRKQYLSFWGGSIVGVLLAQSDVLIAKYFLDSNTLGFYALLRRVSNLISLPQAIVNWSINVEVARKFALADKVALQESATKGLVIAVPVALLMFVGISITTPFWFTLFDITFSSLSLGILIILMVGQLINVLSGANLLFANQCKEEYFVFKSRLFALILSYVMMSVCAWYWGGVGLAFGCAFPMLVLNFMVTYRVRKNIGVWTSVPILHIGK